ncbi:MAG: hypothetical protein B6U86_05235 [Candidatus Altiarchaeales archaeon ex4484_43]|nr:MAG: hypothetical protein B6U86_05235 [Candidatus Altiarchaeales archaeon ex4484_43]
MEVNMDLLKEVLGIMDDLLEKLPEDVIDEFSRSEDFERYEKLYTVVNEYTGKPKQKEYIDKNVKSVLSTIDNLLKKLPEDVIDEFSRSKQREMGKKKVLPKGKPITVRSEEEFLETCKGLTRDFRGSMFLSGDVGGERYFASLLIDKGDIIGSTFEFRGLITFRERAIDEIKSKLKGSSGILNIFEFDEEDMKLAREKNKSALLKNSVPLSSMGMKIKPLMEKWVKEREARKEGPRPIKIPEIFKVEKKFNLIELARGPDKIRGIEKMELGKVDIGEMKNLLKGMESKVGDRKIEELRRIKEERERKIAERLTKIKRREPPREAIKEGEKVKTPIDRLYSLVKKYKRIKIDDRLAHTLGVNKPQIEEWAVILEEHDLIELHYPTIGEPEIRIVKDETEKS